MQRRTSQRLAEALPDVTSPAPSEVSQFDQWRYAGAPLKPGSEAAKAAARAYIEHALANPELRRMFARVEAARPRSLSDEAENRAPKSSGAEAKRALIQGGPGVARIGESFPSRTQSDIFRRSRSVAAATKDGSPDSSHLEGPERRDHIPGSNARRQFGEGAGRSVFRIPSLFSGLVFAPHPAAVAGWSSTLLGWVITCFVGWTMVNEGGVDAVETVRAAERVSEAEWSLNPARAGSDLRAYGFEPPSDDDRLEARTSQSSPDVRIPAPETAGISPDRSSDGVTADGQTGVDAKGAEDALGLDPESRRRIQRQLTLSGFDTRGVDGIFGPRTRAAISEWQRTRGYSVTGFLNAAQLADLEREIVAKR